jgi:hypothetical protein
VECKEKYVNIHMFFLSINNLKYSTEKDLSNFSPSINIPKPKDSVRSHGQSETLANRGKRGMWRGIQNGGEPHKNISQSVSSLLQKGFYKIPALCQTEGHRPIHRCLRGSSNDRGYSSLGKGLCPNWEKLHVLITT